MSLTTMKVDRTLLVTLSSFAWAHKLSEEVWVKQKADDLSQAGITSIGDLATACRDGTLNLDLELFGVENQWNESVIDLMQAFLPGPTGLRTFKLAELAASRVEDGSAVTAYVHRPENGKAGNEVFRLGPQKDRDWILKVDCAGFVRSCLKHTTKSTFRMTLSDRDFMRAKDFYAFFATIPHTVLDPGAMEPTLETHLKWRLVPDLRMVIPGDVIVYRPRGNAAGGAAFTENDRKDLRHILRAVKMAQLYRASGPSTTPLNRDPTLQPWVDAVIKKFIAVGIQTPRDLKKHLSQLNDMLAESNFMTMYQETLDLMKECLETQVMNTGHIVFSAGPAILVGENEYRIKVVHSTKHGKVDPQTGEVIQGVQKHFRRFAMTTDPETGRVYWTRSIPMNMAKPLETGEESVASDEEGDDDPNDDMEEDELDKADPNDPTSVIGVVKDGEEPAIDDVSGAGDALVEVLAARMAF